MHVMEAILGMHGCNFGKRGINPFCYVARSLPRKKKNRASTSRTFYVHPANAMPTHKTLFSSFLNAVYTHSLSIFVLVIVDVCSRTHKKKTQDFH